MQALTLLHATPCSALALAPSGVGVGDTDQVVPLNASAIGTRKPSASSCAPTAMHEEVFAHETAIRSPVGARAGGITGCVVQPNAATTLWKGRPDRTIASPIAISSRMLVV